MYKPAGLLPDSVGSLNLWIIGIKGKWSTFHGLWAFCGLSSLDKSQRSCCYEQNWGLIDSGSLYAKFNRIMAKLMSFLLDFSTSYYDNVFIRKLLPKCEQNAKNPNIIFCLQLSFCIRHTFIILELTELFYKCQLACSRGCLKLLATWDGYILSFSILFLLRMIQLLWPVCASCPLFPTLFPMAFRGLPASHWFVLVPLPLILDWNSKIMLSLLSVIA